MKVLLAVTESFIKREAGTLRAAATAGSSVAISVESSQGVTVDDFIVVGHEGNELAELCTVTAVTDTTITVTTLKFSHNIGEPFVVFRFNKRKFYGATSSTGSYTELTSDGSPKDISVDDPQGTFLEYTGSTYTHFKATYYNSTTADETDVDDADAVAGDESLRYAPLYEIRKHAGFAGNPRMSDGFIETKRTIAENEIKSALAARYVLPLTYVPGIITHICILLAAGHMDYPEFGSEGEGVKWLVEARSLLKAIKEGRQLLLDADDVELTRVTNSNRLSGFPDDEEENVERGTMDQTF